MKFMHVTLYVGDMEASLAFYRDIVGLELRRRFTGAPGQELAFLGEGETEVELICDKSRAQPQLHSDVSIGFAAANVTALRQQLLAQGCPGVSEMISAGPARFFFAADPDGMRVQFMQS